MAQYTVGLGKMPTWYSMESGTIRSLLHGHIPLEHTTRTIDTYRAQNEWKWEEIPFRITTIFLKKKQFNRINVPVYTNKLDTIYWGLSQHGKFTVQSMFSQLLQQDLNITEHTLLYNWIWKIQIPPKLKTFLWLIMHNRLPIKHYLHHIGITLDDHCQICRRHPETINHILLHHFNIKHI